MQAQRVSQRIGLAIAAAAGWKVQVQPPPARCVIVGAPHTSGWDLPLTLLLMLAASLRLRWIGKDTLFRFVSRLRGWSLRQAQRSVATQGNAHKHPTARAGVQRLAGSAHAPPRATCMC